MADREERQLHAPLSSSRIEDTALVSRDMVRPVASDLVLGIVPRGMTDMTLVIEIAGMNGDDRPRHPARLRVPTYMIADPEPLAHRVNSSNVAL